MNQENLHKYFNNSKYADCYLHIEQLETDDFEQEIRIYCHKIILAQDCEFFDGLFTHGKPDYIYQGIDAYIISIRFVQTAYNVILSKYTGVKAVPIMPKWQRVLETFWCRDYFNLPNDMTALYNLKVPSCGFELLLDVVKLFELNDKLITLISNNLYIGCDLKKYFPKLLIQQILAKNLVVITLLDDAVYLVKAHNEKTTKFSNFDIIYSITVSKDNKLLVTDHGTCIKIWDIYSNTLITTINADEKRYTYVLSNDNKLLAVLYDDSKCVKLWSVDTGELIRTITDSSNFLYHLAMSSDTKYLIASYDTVDEEFNIKIWEISSGQLLHTLKNNSNIIHELDISDDNTMVASANHNKTITVWNIETGKLINTLSGHTGFVYAVKWLSDNLIVSGSRDNTIKIWNVKDSSLVNTLYGHKDRVCDIILSNDKRFFLSQSWDRVSNIWNKNGDLISTHKDFLSPQLIYQTYLNANNK